MRSTLNVAGFSAIAHVLIAVLHLFIGSPFFLTGPLTLISFVSLTVLPRKIILPSDLFLMTLGLVSATFPLLFKAVFLQPLDVNLVAPRETIFVLVIAFLNIWAALALSRHVVQRGTYSKTRRFYEQFDYGQSHVVGLFVLGYGIHFLHLTMKPDLVTGREGFGGFGTLSFLMAFAQILIADNVYKHRSSSAKFVAVIAFVCSLAFSIIGNTKREMADFLLAFALVGGLRGYRPSVRGVLVGGFSLSAFLFVLIPLIHLVRSEGGAEFFLERVFDTFVFISESGTDFAFLQLMAAASIRSLTYVYAPTMTYYYPVATQLDRFSLIFPLDQVVRMPMEYSYSVLSLTNEIAESVLPSFLIDKDSSVASDEIAWIFHIRGQGSLARPVIGFTATNFATFGYLGLFLTPFITLLPLFSFINLFFGDARRSLAAMTLVLSSWHIVEQGIDSLVGYGLRQIVLMALFFYVLRLVMKKESRW